MAAWQSRRRTEPRQRERACVGVAREVRGPEAEDRRRSQGTVGAFAREGERCGAVAADLLELRCCDLSLRGEGKWRVSGLRGGTRNR